MIIIGIDPGTAKTGYAVIEIAENSQAPVLLECACITTPAEVDMHFRLHTLYSELSHVAKKHPPELMIIERLFFNTNAKTAISVGQARGVSLLVAADHNMSVVEYTALQAKNTLTGYGRADKKEMQEAVRKYMQLTEIIKPDDANDALAMILCHIEKLKIASDAGGAN